MGISVIKAIYFEGPGGQSVKIFRLNPANGSAFAIWYRKADLTAGAQRRPGVHAAFAVDEFAAEDDLARGRGVGGMLNGRPPMPTDIFMPAITK